MTLPDRFFFSFLILALFGLGLKPGIAAAGPAGTHPGGISIEFVETGHIIPRRAGPLLHIKTTGVGKLDVAIAHIGEGDVLYSLSELSAQTLGAPEEDKIIWRGVIDTGASADDPPGTEKITPFNILQNIGTLKTGLYVVSVKDGDANIYSTPTVAWFAITNLGVEAFSGKDGVTAQVRLLSTLGAAPGVDVALIAMNNREIARGRTDNLGFVRFNAAATAGTGLDFPTALYAYGADGEFTPLALAPYRATPPLPKAWLELSQATYKPGERVKGFFLLRDASGSAVSQSGLRLQMERQDGGIAAVQTLTDLGGGAYVFSLPMPSLPGVWALTLYAPDDTVLAIHPMTPAAASPQTVTPSLQAADTIIISPGRRSFQPGAPADISVQPPFDADMNFAVATDAVTATLDQPVSKDGAAIQVPMPENAVAGAYVIASAFALASTDEAAKAGLIRHVTGTAWLDADKGDKRLGVKIDAPENAAPGAALNIGVSLTNSDGQPAFAALTAFPADQPNLPDPLAYFLGQTPLGIAISDSYTRLTQSGSAMDRAALPLQSLSAFTPVVWTSPVAVGGDGKVSLPIVLPNTPARLRLYVISWSASQLGLGASAVTTAGKLAAKPVVPPATNKTAWQSVTIPEGASRKMNFHEAYVSAAPLLAVPISVDKSGAATFVDPNAAAINALIESTLTPLKDEKLLQTAYVLRRLQDAGAAIPKSVLASLLDKVAVLAADPGAARDQILFANYILLEAGFKNGSNSGAVVGNHTRPPATALGEASLAALDAERGDNRAASDYAKKALAAPADGQDAKLFTLLLLGGAKQPVTAAALKSLAAHYPMTQTHAPLIELALALAAGIPASDVGPYKIKLNGSDATATGFLDLKRDPAGPPLALDNPNPAPLYLIQRQ